MLAQRIALAGGEIPPTGSGVHLAATLAGLRTRFEVLPMLAAEDSAPTVRASRARRVLPGWVRGLRQDLLAIREDRAFAARAISRGREFQPDLVYARSEYLSSSGLRVARALHVPVVLEVNGLLARDVRTIYRSPLEPLGVLLERFKHRRADAIVTVSPGLKRLLEPLGADQRKVTVVPNSVDPERVRAARSRPRAGSVVIGWAGHLMRWHLEALELLIEVAPAVIRDAPAVEFMIVGGGPGLDRLEAQAEAGGLAAKIRFTGSVSYADIPRRLEEIDIAVIPAVFDYAFPVKLVEFGAAGIPVVAPASASLDEQLVPGVEYEPFRADDRDALHDALVRLALDAERRRSLGAALQQAVCDRFTWTATGRTLAEVVDRVLGAEQSQDQPV